MSHRNIFKKILFCTDFSANADLAFRYALNIAEGNPDCELLIFHTVPEPDAQFWKTYIYEMDSIDEKAKADIDAKVAAAYISKIPPTVKFSVKMAVGNVNDAILETAEAEKTDLIIIGRQGSSVFETHFFGNTTERIARKAVCPVLIIPGPAGKK